MQFKEVLKTAAEERQALYQNLTPVQKLAKLDAMFGKGEGAKKERARIAGIKVEKVVEVKKEVVPDIPKKKFKKGQKPKQ